MFWQLYYGMSYLHTNIPQVMRLIFRSVSASTGGIVNMMPLLFSQISRNKKQVNPVLSSGRAYEVQCCYSSALLPWERQTAIWGEQKALVIPLSDLNSSEAGQYGHRLSRFTLNAIVSRYYLKANIPPIFKILCGSEFNNEYLVSNASSFGSYQMAYLAG